MIKNLLILVLLVSTISFYRLWTYESDASAFWNKMAERMTVRYNFCVGYLNQ